MKKLILITVILLLTGLNINAQYSLMSKGQLCPFDSAVAIQIDTYRLESKKLDLAEALINNLKASIISKDSSILLLETKDKIKDQIISTQLDIIRDKDRTIEALTFYYSPPKQDWWQKNKNYVLLGAIITIGLGGVVLVSSSL